MIKGEDSRKLYWKKLFPSVNSMEEFNELTKKCSNMTLNDLEEEYNKSISMKYDYEYFNTEYKNEFVQVIDYCLQKIKDKNRWVYYYKPLLLTYTEDLYNLIKNVKIIKDKDKFFYIAVFEICSILESISFRTIITEINTLRNEKRLLGDSPEKRGDYYRDVILCDKKYIEETYIKYPELTRILDVLTKNETEFIIKIIKDTNDEYSEICNRFKIDKEDYLEGFTLSSGDRHKKGKSVSILYFHSGKKLVYKPRSLEIDEAYNKFIKYLNEEHVEDFYNLETAKVYNNKGKNAGWVEFIEFKECNDENEVENFYKRIGEILCLLHVFNSSDIHFENIIAKGEYPVLIDLETILNPKIYEESNDNSAVMKATKLLIESIEYCGLLPKKMINKNNKIIDVGGLSGAKNQESNFKVLCVENYTTDEVKVVRKFIDLEPENNNPELAGKIINSGNYVNEIKSSFINLYRWIADNKNSVKEKVNNIFADKKGRMLLRATSSYGQLLDTSYHPQLMTNTIDRKVYLHRIGLQLNNLLERAVTEEIKQMEDCDVPYFEMNTSGNYVLFEEDKRINNFYERTILEEVNSNIDSFGEVDLERQVSIINIAFYGKESTSFQYETGIDFVKDSEKSVDNEKYTLNVVKTAGEYVMKKSIKGENNNLSELTWLTAKVGENNIDPSPVEFDLYEGNCGIALFLSYLGALTHDEKVKKAAIEAINPIITNLNHNKEDKIGAFNGISGWLYVLFHMGIILSEDRFIKLVYKKFPSLKSLVSVEKDVDIISGQAGVILVLMNIYHMAKDEKVKKEIIEIADLAYKKIDANKIVTNCGVTWSEQAILGFSHGNFGITSALYSLYNVTKDYDVLMLMKESLKFERSSFNKEKGAWPMMKGEDICPTSWCHGAAGHLLGRIILKEAGYEDEFIDEEINLTMNILKKRGFGHNFSLCHGDLGNLLLLDKAAKVLNDDKTHSEVLNIFNNYMKKAVKENAIEDNFKYEENNGLMVGLSGIGYAALKFMYPDDVLDVLSLN